MSCKGSGLSHEIILPAGSGTIDFKRIFAAPETAGLKYYFVEHDMTGDLWESIQRSISILHKLAPLQ